MMALSLIAIVVKKTRTAFIKNGVQYTSFGDYNSRQPGLGPKDEKTLSDNDCCEEKNIAKNEEVLVAGQIEVDNEKNKIGEKIC